jgi:hypothetical protein
VLPVRVVSFQLLDLDRRVPYFGVCPQQYLDFIDDLHRVGHHRELTAVNIPSRDLFNEGRAGSDCIPYHDEYCHTGSHGTQPVVRLKTWMIMSARLCKDPVVDPPRCRIALTADLTAERRADGRRGRCPAQIPAFSRDRDHVRVRDRGTRQVDHCTQANFGETGTGISGAREVVSDDHELRHGALAGRRHRTGVARVRHLKSDVDGGQQARFLRDPLSGNIEGRAVVDRGADNRQAVTDIDS